jgi:hypothetical protein
VLLNSTNLAKGTVRQIGHQEIDGVSIVKNITKVAETIEQPINQDAIGKLILQRVKKSWLILDKANFLEENNFF